MNLSLSKIVRKVVFQRSNITRTFSDKITIKTGTRVTEIKPIKMKETDVFDPKHHLKPIPAVLPESCGDAIDIDEVEEEEMWVTGPAGLEWGGPTRGGKRPEPTRYGDWERKGRVTDF